MQISFSFLSSLTALLIFAFGWALALYGGLWVLFYLRTLWTDSLDDSSLTRWHMSRHCLYLGLGISIVLFLIHNSV